MSLDMEAFYRTKAEAAEQARKLAEQAAAVAIEQLGNAAQHERVAAALVAARGELDQTEHSRLMAELQRVREFHRTMRIAIAASVLGWLAWLLVGAA